MGANHIPCNQNHEIIRRAIRGAQMIREGKQNLEIAIAAMAALKDGDGTQASHFDLLASECSITAGDYADANTAAKALFDETNSANGNTSSAAAEQLAAYLGV